MMRIAIGSEPRLLCILRTVVKFQSQEAGFSKPDAEHIALAIDEAAANIIRHTYGGRHDPRRPWKYAVCRTAWSLFWRIGAPRSGKKEPLPGPWRN